MTAATASPTTTVPPVAESSPDDLAIQRYLLDLALQPLDSFDGFTRLENFGGTALRYQLNVISYALAMAQYTRTPAFTGYLAEAHANAIQKMCDKRVWGFWRIENLIGNQNRDPDPIVKDNVMYTGYFGQMIGLYETLNADDRFDQPGGLTLRWKDKRSFVYDFASLAEALRRNMAEHKCRPQYPCEPHLVYPVCNLFALNTLVMYDRLHGSVLTGTFVEEMRARWQKDHWLRNDGRWTPGKTDFGVVISPPTLAYDACMVFWLNGTMPEFAEQTWGALRKRAVTTRGRVTFKGQVWDKLDVGNYNVARGRGFTLATAMHAARELGDEEIATGLERSLDHSYEVVRENGARQYAKASLLTNGTHAIARFGRAGAMRDLIRGVVPPEWRTGPILAQAAYPDVLVARAVSDGQGLELVLRPGDGPCRTTLAIERLTPGRSYQVSGAAADQLTAGPTGGALIEIDLADRTEVRLWPAG